MKKMTIYIVLAVLCLNLTAHAQGKPDNITALKIGDTVPNITINNIINYKDKNGKPTNTAKISDFKGKLLILDFWATYCAPCIAMIPMMDSLQEVYKGKIQLISVTDQSEKTIRSFLLTHKELSQKPPLPCVVADKILGQMFPNNFIPHYVWIDRSGVILAFTSDYDLNGKNIQSVLDNGHLLKYTPKNDIDVNKPLFSGPYFPENGVIDYRVFIKGHLEGTGAGAHPRQNASTVGMAWTNIELGGMYIRCGEKMIKNFSPKNLILNVRDSSDLLQKLIKTNRTEWFREHEYSIDVIIPIREKDSLYTIMLKEINRNGKYFGSIHRQKTNVLKLSIIGDTSRLSAREAKFKNTLSNATDRALNNAPIAVFIKWLNNHQKDIPIVLDNTGVPGNVNINLSPDALNLQTIKRDLNKQGLDLQEAQESIDMLSISDNKITTLIP